MLIKPKTTKILIYSFFLLLLPLTSVVFAQNISFTPLTDSILEQKITDVANFFVTVSVILLVIYVIWVGIKMMASGGNPEKFAQASKAFKYVLIGGLVILGVGVIINTIVYVISF